MLPCLTRAPNNNQDLNYRINGGRRVVAWLLLKAPRLAEVLRANDQLALQRARGAAFAGYDEGPLAFPPTFKVAPAPGAPRYAAARAPAWTDRVLWRVARRPGGGGGGGDAKPSLDGAGAAAATAAGAAAAAAGAAPVAAAAGDEAAVAVRQAYYSWVPAACSSDHKPVVAGFALSAPDADAEAAATAAVQAAGGAQQAAAWPTGRALWASGSSGDSSSSCSDGNEEGGGCGCRGCCLM